MKAARLFGAVLLLACSAVLLAADAAPAAFDRLKQLAGDWEGTYQGEKPVATKVNFKVVSNGSAVMLTADDGSAGEMITMFHPDGSSVMVTHYCAAKNQPRMRLAKSSDPNQLVFDFLDVTNLTGPDAEHMKRLVITFLDAGHHTQEWTFVQKGKEGVGRFDFHRVKK